MAWYDKYKDRIRDEWRAIGSLLNPGQERNIDSRDTGTPFIKKNNRSSDGGTSRRSGYDSYTDKGFIDSIVGSIVSNSDGGSISGYQTGLGNTEDPYGGLDGVILGNLVGELTPSEVANFNFNHNEALYDRQFQEYMSNTAYQRQVADMQAAGVNPALAMNNGAGGAITPSGASASSSAGQRSSLDFVGLITSLLGLGIQNKVADATIAKTNAETNIIEAQTPWVDILNELTAGEKEANIAYIKSNKDLNEQQIKNAEVARNKMLTEISEIKSQIDLNKATEAEKRQYVSTLIADAALKKAEAWQIYQMTPALKALNDAQSGYYDSLERLQGLYNIAESRKLMKGYYEAVISSTEEQARALGLQNEWNDYIQHPESFGAGVGHAFKVLGGSGGAVVGAIGYTLGSGVSHIPSPSPTPIRGFGR